MLSVEQITSGYGRSTVLRDLSLTLEDGELVAILGPNGAGKSTLMKTIVGILRPTHGHIVLDGVRIDGKHPDYIVRKGVVLVPEGRRVFSNLSVRENLLLASHARRKQGDVRADLQFVFDLFPVLNDRQHARGDELSGGQQQMVALGRAVMQRPSVVLMDEPSIGLSPLIVQQLPRMIRGVQEQTGAAVLLVEQDAGLALTLASRGYVLRAGRVVHQGSSEELGHSSVLLEAYLGQDTATPSGDDARNDDRELA